MKQFITPMFFVLLTACGASLPSDVSTELSSKPKGNLNSPIIVQEFADLQCPACKAAHERVVTPLMEQYSTKIQLEFVHFPLRQIHRNALPAAMAAECAADQGKFWEFINHVYANQETLNTTMFEKYAVAVGVPNIDLFNRCANSDAKKEGVLADYERGRALDVNGTPTFFVNGQKVESTLPALSAAIEAELAKVDTQL